jgi:membrane associated rhomboid family serine protease
VDQKEKDLWDLRTRSFLSRQSGGLKRSADQPDSGSKVRPTILEMTFPGIYKAAKRFRPEKDVTTAQGSAVNRYNESDIRVDGDRNAAAVLLSRKALSSPSAGPIGDQPDHIIGEFIEQVRDAIAPVSEEDYRSFLDHRPFFTWFMIVSQTLILAISLLIYGFGPWGFTTRTYSKKVFVPSLSLQEVEYGEPSNVWVGPPAAALIRLGAKFAPCMRRDRLVFRNIEKDRLEERDTACCVRNDESGCAQTTADKCSELLSSFHKWDTSGNKGPPFRLPLGPNQFASLRRTSGTVCGQDPRYCESPASSHPNEWPDDITKWPLCTRPTRTRLSEPHMSCEVIARPCCIGVYGQCHITTQEFCDHVKGHFHEEATLCSQVSCMKDVCGLLSFMDDERPDQFYRAFLSIFLHAGILHLACSLAFYILFMQSVEQLIGRTRLAIIYLGSGIGGNLASAAFVPYRAEVGPAGSILGVMACSIVVIIWNWELLEDPARNLATKIAITAVFFMMGLLLPWIDNYAHLAGFLTGMCLSLLLIPFMGVKSSNDSGEFVLRKRKQLMVLFGTLFLLFMIILLCFLVWAFPIYNCEWCKYFNCLISLFNEEICPDQDIRITRLDIL